MFPDARMDRPAHGTKNTPVFSHTTLDRGITNCWYTVTIYTVLIEINLNLFSIEVLGATEDVALGESFAAQLMDLNHLAESYESNESIRWQQTQRHLQRLLNIRR